MSKPSKTLEAAWTELDAATDAVFDLAKALTAAKERQYTAEEKLLELTRKRRPAK